MLGQHAHDTMHAYMLKRHAHDTMHVHSCSCSMHTPRWTCIHARGACSRRDACAYMLVQHAHDTMHVHAIHAACSRHDAVHTCSCSMHTTKCMCIHAQAACSRHSLNRRKKRLRKCYSTQQGSARSELMHTHLLVPFAGRACPKCTSCPPLSPSARRGTRVG